MARSAAVLRRRIAFFQRNLLRSGLATEEEIASVADPFSKRRDKDALWEHWAELKAIAIARVTTKKSTEVADESLEAAVAALSDQSYEVRLSSIGKAFHITPASFKRIRTIEDHAWWVNMLTAGRALLLADVGDVPAAKGEVCSECDRPLVAGALNELLERIGDELDYQRSMLYAQVIAPTPAPVDNPVKWANKITPAEDSLLMEAYHRVTYDVIMQLPEPRSLDKQRELPRSWAFLFAQQAERERRPAIEIMRDRSLGSTIAVMVIESIRQSAMKGKIDARDIEDAAS